MRRGGKSCPFGKKKFSCLLDKIFVIRVNRLMEIYGVKSMKKVSQSVKAKNKVILKALSRESIGKNDQSVGKYFPLLHQTFRLVVAWARAISGTIMGCGLGGVHYQKRNNVICKEHKINSITVLLFLIYNVFSENS